MKNLWKNNIIDKLLYGFQFILLLALVILEYLSGYKAGVMKHLYARKLQYLSTIYNESGMMLHSVILVALFIILIIIYKNRMNSKRKGSIVRFALYSIILISAFYVPYLKDLNIYAYSLMGLELILGIEVLKIVVNK